MEEQDDCVIALYDFTPENDNELQFRENDVFLVSIRTVKGIGDGWWEGELNGKSGYFPSNYVTFKKTKVELDSDFEEETSSFEGETSSRRPSMAVLSAPVLVQRRPLSYTALNLLGKSIYRYSNFVKSGAEDFVLGVPLEVETDQKIFCQEGPFGVEWQPLPHPYKVSVEILHEKNKNAKKAVSYLFKSTKCTVERRYHDLEWLQDQLLRRCRLITIPDLPEKIKTQQGARVLESWINKISTHPVFGNSAPFEIFMQCSSDKKEWKGGKKSVERSPLVGAALLSTIVPAKPKDSPVSDIRRFESFCHKQRQSFSKLSSHCDAISSAMVKTHYSRFSSICMELSKGNEVAMVCCWRETCDLDKQLTKAILVASQTFEWIGKKWAEAVAWQTLTFEDYSREHNSIIIKSESTCNVQGECLSRTCEVAKLVAQKKTDQALLDAVLKKCEVISALTEAEMNNFHSFRRHDIKKVLEDIVLKEIETHQAIIEKLQMVKSAIESA